VNSESVMVNKKCNVSKYASIWLITTITLNKSRLMVMLVLRICGGDFMEILIVSSKENADKIINDALSNLNFEVEIENLNDENEKDFKFEKNYSLVFINDEDFFDYSYHFKAFVFSHLLKTKTPTMVFLDDKKRVDVFCGLNLMDYFFTPVDWQRVGLRIKIIEQNKTNSIIKLAEDSVPNKYVIKTKGEVLLLDYDQIRFFEKEGKKLYVHLVDQTVTVNESVKALMTKIPKSFVRVHNSYVVNTKYISKIVEVGNRSYQIKFDNFERVAYMSRYRSDALLKDFYKLDNKESVKVANI